MTQALERPVQEESLEQLEQRYEKVMSDISKRITRVSSALVASSDIRNNLYKEYAKPNLTIDEMRRIKRVIDNEIEESDALVEEQGRLIRMVVGKIKYEQPPF
jgi:hypothetical protein